MNIKEATNASASEISRKATASIANALSKMDSSTILSELTTCSLSLPSEELKGRIIGREGKNIRLLEQLTGTNVIVDETPGAIFLSGFDPIKREIARRTLSQLIQEGRIHPTRIEQVFSQTQLQMQEILVETGEKICSQANIYDLHPEIVKLIGQMQFHYSFGQNLALHSLEVSKIMRALCSELNLDSELGARMGLLHDIGKVCPEESETTHAMIGHALALRYSESEKVANGIGAHHNEIEPKSIEASLVGLADSLSAARLGARREAAQQYVKRLSNLESIAKEFAEVKELLILQAGKELRIIVDPEEVSAEQMTILARSIANEIGKRHSFPGKIKVNIIRSEQAVEYAR